MTAFTGRRVASFEDLVRPGDYTGPHSFSTPSAPGGRVVWFLLPLHEGKDAFDRAAPASGIHGAYEPPWVFRECQDGSLEIRESIACGRGTPDGEYWHGYLDEGHTWRQV